MREREREIERERESAEPRNESSEHWNPLLTFKEKRVELKKVKSALEKSFSSTSLSSQPKNSFKSPYLPRVDLFHASFAFFSTGPREMTTRKYPWNRIRSPREGGVGWTAREDGQAESIIDERRRRSIEARKLERESASSFFLQATSLSFCPGCTRSSLSDGDARWLGSERTCRCAALLSRERRRRRRDRRRRQPPPLNCLILTRRSAPRPLPCAVLSPWQQTALILLRASGKSD